MKYVLKNQEMQMVDSETIHGIGIPGLVLMERASKAIADQVAEISDHSQRILVISGIGNNGGDALACTRILLEQDYLVDYMIIGNIEKASDDLKLQFQILKKLGYFPLESEDANFHEYDLLIEGIFGVGLSREVGGVYKEVIERMNACGKPVVAIDIPSGISGDSGKVLDCAVHAAHTITFGGYKRGHLLYPGREYCGNTQLVSIGFHDQTIKKYATGYTLEESDYLMPERKAYSNKGNYGKVLIIAGNETMSGAACFAAEAALRMGAGLVKVLSDPQNRQVLQTRLPEILFGERRDLKESLKWCDCILFGPGVGVSKETKEMLQVILKEGTKPLVIDADGLNTISKFGMEIDYPYGVIMTPHLMEAARLMSCDITQIKEDLCQSAERLAVKYHCTAVLKDAATIVAREDNLVYINQSGNDGMATGGSGDVLAGMITGLLGGGLSSYEAAVHGVYLHGLAGDHARRDLGAYSMIASDIITHIKDVTGGDYEPVL